VIDSTGDVLVNSCAGSGKTSTLLKYCAKQKGKGIYVAYNSIIAQEVKKKISPNTEVTTAHSLAYRYWCSVGKKPNLGFLTAKIVENYFEPSLCKSQFVNSLKHILDAYSNSRLSEEDYFKQNAYYLHHYGGIKQLLEHMKEGKVPITHDLYLKFYSDLGINLNRDFFVWDEVQDLGENSVNIVNSQTCPRVLVGDSMQSIYSFRKCINGFDVFDFPLLNLSTSFRNTQSVANLASYVAGYAGFYGEPPRTIRGVGTKQNDTTCLIGHTNYFVFTNKANQPELTVVGDYDWPTILNKLEDLVHLRDGRKNMIKNKFLLFYQDLNHFYVDCQQKSDYEWMSLIKFSGEGMRSVHRLKDALTRPVDPNSFVSNVHKSKGLEWNKVVLDDDFLSPDKICAVNKADYNNREELNKLYVTITRAMTKVVLPKDFIVGDFMIDLIKDKVNGKVW